MKNRGFTLVEILVVIVILALLSGIAIYTVNNITDKAEENYYVSTEDTLKMAGNDYFSDNRADRPIDDYNFVSLDSLVEHEYLEQLKTYDKKANCSNESGVYIYNTDDGTEYEACLICGTYKSQGSYCKGEKPGQIMITGRTNTGKTYNPVLSYAGTPWAQAGSVKITFKLMGDEKNVTNFEIYNSNTNTSFDTCTSISAKSCSLDMSVTGSYYVIAYDGSEKVANKKYFNVKIDNTKPTFDYRDNETVKFLGEGYEYDYSNALINVHDDNGYKSAVYSIKDLVNDRMIVNSQDITESNLEFENTLPSGNYQLSATVTDYAKNSSEPKTLNFEVRYVVNLIFFDNEEKKYDIGKITVYKGGKYEGLPVEIKVGSKTYSVDWYDNTNFVGTVYNTNTLVDKSSTHNLYGKQARLKINSADYPICNNGGDFTYNGENQTLASANTGYTVSNNIHKDAGTYTIMAMPNANYVWQDGTRTYKIFQCTIKPYITDFNPGVNPCVEGLVYNAYNQYIVDMSLASSTSSPLTNVVRFGSKREVAFSASPVYVKDAGSYDVTYTLNSNNNFVWYDGTSGDKTYTCKIAPYPVEFGDCFFVYAGLTNQLGTHMGKGFVALRSERVHLKGTPTNIKSGNDMVYETDVVFDMPSNSTVKTSNYYIVDTKVDCAIKQAPATIAAASDRKLYDGTALTKDEYTLQVGAINAYGDSISSVTVTGSQTEVGSSNNVPSNAVIVSGGTDTTKYYNITYTNGKLEVYDDVPPTCSVSVSEDGVLSANVSDNYKLWTYGWSDYWHARSTTKTISSAGKYTFWVRDTSDNRTKCEITVAKVPQYRSQTCSTGNRCSFAGCYRRYSCVDDSCDCKTEDEEGNCIEHKSCRNSNCNCETYNESISKCGCATWAKWSDWLDWPYSSGCTGGEYAEHSKNQECRTIYRAS